MIYAWESFPIHFLLLEYTLYPKRKFHITKNTEDIGKIIIVDPDPDNPEDYLRQVAEALNQGGMRCVVVRGNGAYAVGADIDQAWANAAMVEHSMHIHLLARQANLKI